MLIHIKDIERARQAAKSLKLNLDDWGVKRPLTWHQETVAKMLGHADWAALCASLENGHPPSPLDEEVEHDVLTRRRDYQTQVLVDRVGAEAVRRCSGRDVFDTIARHVAPSGRPRAGKAFQTYTATVEEDGVYIPFTLEFWTEDALFFWKDLHVRKGYEHVSKTFDPGVEEFYAVLGGAYAPAAWERCKQFISSKPNDNLDKLALLAMGTRLSGNLASALEIIGDAYNIGSWAWAPVARERRRRHAPVRWWEEPETRPFMHVLYEKAMIDVSLGTEHGLRSGLQMFNVIFALNRDDPLRVIRTVEDELGFVVLDKPKDAPGPSDRR
jgi:hypothetical protein